MWKKAPLQERCRPCAECRREDFNRFKKYWLVGNAEAGFNEKTPIGLIDNFVHVERVDEKNRKKTHRQVAGQLPDGAMVKISDRAYVKSEDRLYEWSPGGYKSAGSEIETGARESIGETVMKILEYFRIDINVEEAIRERDW